MYNEGNHRPIAARTDVDECSEGLDDCDLDSQSCLNTHGGYQCLSKKSKECPGGYVWKDDAAACVDIDECSQGSHNCGSSALCVNTDGGFQCKRRDVNVGRAALCPQGYRYSRHTRQCQDTDECREGTHNCSFSTQSCVNTAGGFICRDRNVCPEGYRMNKSTRSCADIDECSEGRYVCSQRGTRCLNTPGSYRCVNKARYQSCPEGWRYDLQVKGCKGAAHICTQSKPPRSSTQTVTLATLGWAAFTAVLNRRPWVAKTGLVLRSFLMHITL